MTPRKKARPKRNGRGINTAAYAFARRLTCGEKMVHGSLIYAAFINGAKWADTHPLAAQRDRRRAKR